MAICFGGLRSYLVSTVAILDLGIDEPLFSTLPLVIPTFWQFLLTHF